MTDTREGVAKEMCRYLRKCSYCVEENCSEYRHALKDLTIAEFCLRREREAYDKGYTDCRKNEFFVKPITNKGGEDATN